MGISITEGLSEVATLATMGFTGWAAWAAARAAKAATAANKITEASDRRRDRAYLAAEPGGVHRFDATGKPLQAIGHVIIKNVGHMPAKNVAVFVLMTCTNANRRLETFALKPDPHKIDRALQAGGEMRMGADEDYLALMEEVDKTENCVFVWGVIYYDDGFDERRTTRFCHRYPGGNVRRRRIDPLPDNDPRALMARMVQSRYEEEVILAQDARLYEIGNDAD